MGDRLSVLVGSGIGSVLVTAGVSAAMLTGAGIAVASPESSASNAGTTKSESVKPSDARDDARDDDETTEVDAGDTTEDSDESADAEPEESADDQDADDAATGIDDDAPEIVAEEDATDEAVVADENVVAEEAVEVLPAAEAPVVEEAAEEVSAQEPETASVEDAAPVAVSVTTERLTKLETATEAVEEAAATPRRQTLLSLIGTVIFNIYSVAIRVLGGPPILPPNSTVTVKTAKLEIDCGDGYEIPADWYVPEGVTPTRLIYFQHGFMAAGPFYSYTAARLAEATHSIVVSTTLTSNFLACDGCWVGGSPMHKAVADLFVDGNNALAESALAAGYSSTLLDGVQKVALIGHSAGGGLSAGAAGYMTENGTIGKLAGVVMLDGVGFGDVTPEALAKLPTDFPIYNLAARAYLWNLSGTTNDAMEAWRPGGFNGVKLTNSSHGDAMTGGNLFVQVAMNLVTGWPKPANVEAAEMISAGWLNDMFTGTQTSGFYGAPNETFEIETGSGTAGAYVLPGPVQQQTIVDWLFTFGAKILFGIDFATCADDPDDDDAEMVGPNTALSLDGRAKAGQSIGQQCVHG